MLGEEGLAQYRQMFTSYMKRLPLIHRKGEEEEEEEEDNPQPAPLSDSQGQSGYFRINPADGGAGGGAASYIEMEEARERKAGDEGYSRYSTTTGGYIALVDINK